MCTRAMLLDQGVLCFFLPPTTPKPCPGLHPGLSFSPNPTNWRGPILQMKKMPPGPWPPAQLAESELLRPQSPLSCCHVGRAQGCLLWDSSSRSGGGWPVFPLEAVARPAPSLVPGAGWGSRGARGPEPLAWPPPLPPPSGSVRLPLGDEAKSLLAWPVCSWVSGPAWDPGGHSGGGAALLRASLGASPQLSGTS